MKLRRLTSLTALLAFTILFVTGIVLYVVPQGRVAYWSEWTLFGLSKEQWGSLHTNVGLLFLVFGSLHVWLNWKVITAYLKDRARQLKVFTVEFNAALVLVAAFSAGTLLEVPPFAWIQTLGEAVKESGSRRYGEPPYGHAELSSLELFSKRMDLDLDRSLGLLREAGLAVEGPRQTLLEVAQANRVTPQRVWEVIQEAAREGGAPLPPTPPSGLGRRSLEALCAGYGLDPGWAVEVLAEQGIPASAGESIKTIAERADRQPAEIFELLREASLGSGPDGG